MRCPSPISIKNPKGSAPSDQLTVPCGRCGACRHNRRADWSFRLQEELSVCYNAFFITLTYSDEKLPFNSDGEITLVKKHIQDFIKRLRKENKAEMPELQLRYYCVGEYGTETDRPHYHLILYNCKNTIIDRIEKIWKNGHVHVGKVNEMSIPYVLKFHINVNKDEQDRQKEFALMSKRPALGHTYLKRAKKWHRENIHTYIINNGFKQRMPRFYRDKIFTEEERRFEAQKSFIKEDKEYWKEYDRLVKLKIENPDKNMFDSQIREAKKVKNKGKEGNTF